MEVLRRPHRTSMAPVRQPAGALMSPSEIHAFGIDMVASFMKENGYWLEWVNPDPTYMPQIKAMSRAGELVFVIVRTACYPETGLLPDDAVVRQHVLCSGENGGLPCFGSVSISCAAGSTRKEWATPVRNAGFYVKHPGIQLIKPCGNGFQTGEPNAPAATRSGGTAYGSQTFLR